MAAHSSILAWRLPWTEEPGGATLYGVAMSRTRLKRLSLHRSNLDLTQAFSSRSSCRLLLTRHIISCSKQNSGPTMPSGERTTFILTESP